MSSFQRDGGKVGNALTAIRRFSPRMSSPHSSHPASATCFSTPVAHIRRAQLARCKGPKGATEISLPDGGFSPLRKSRCKWAVIPPSHPALVRQYHGQASVIINRWKRRFQPDIRRSATRRACSSTKGNLTSEQARYQTPDRGRCPRKYGRHAALVSARLPLRENASHADAPSTGYRIRLSTSSEILARSQHVGVEGHDVAAHAELEYGIRDDARWRRQPPTRVGKDPAN